MAAVAEENEPPGRLEKIYGKPAALVPAVKQGPVVDGQLKDAVWQKAPRLDFGFIHGYRQRTLGSHGYQNPPPWPGWKLGKEVSHSPVYPAYVKVLTDQKRLYMAFRGAFPGFDKMDEKGRAREGMEMFFDVGHHEENNFFQIRIDGNGKVTHTAAEGHDATWTPDDVVSAVTYEKDAWIVEFMIPLKDLWPDETLKTLPKLWGANFYGSVWLDEHGGEETAWSPTHSWYAHRSESFGHLYFEIGSVVPEELRQDGESVSNDMAKQQSRQRKEQ
jgi:hypothetical protein